MNTMELVRQVERAEQRSTPNLRSTPLFPSELFGPARHAILRARQLLLGEQREDGSWLGTQTTDAALPSQLVLLLAYLSQEQTELSRQAVATILDQQLASGGWSLVTDGQPDLSVSVQAYFALKVSGLEAHDARLSKARRVIRELGGADLADATTRYLLALLGQISYDYCPALPPEWQFCNDSSRLLRAALGVVWSHRPTRDVGIEHGVRELFVEQPRDWPKQVAASAARRGRILTGIGTIIDGVFRHLERRGWTPLRCRGLQRAEDKLLECVDSEQFEQLDFFTLLWLLIAVRALGIADDNTAAQACDERLRALLHTDYDSEHAWPRLRSAPMADTAIALRALAASGVPSNHVAILQSREWMLEKLSEYETDPWYLANTLLAFVASRQTDAGDGLPPGLEVSRNNCPGSTQRGNSRARRDMEELARCLGERLATQRYAAPTVIGTVLEAVSAGGRETGLLHSRAVERLRALQCADGGWEERQASDRIRATSQAICGLMAAGVRADDAIILSGINWLTVHQQPGGGWGEDMATLRDSAPTALHTAFALRALVSTGNANHPAARRAVQVLIETQDDDGAWREPCLVARDEGTGRWCTNELHSAAWPLLALSRWVVAATIDLPNVSESIRLRLVNVSADN